MQIFTCSLRLFILPLLTLTAGAIAAADEEPAFSQAELDQMLAPIALYPDALLSQILIASTYPLEVVEAARWSENNPHLEGEEAVAAVEDRGWDPSVQALVAFPGVLTRMNEDLRWTRALGDAFLLQEEQMLDTIQQMRQRAYAAGTLDSLDHLRVEREAEVIVIRPAQTRVIYVPYYNTRVVYGTWWWSAYPPVYWAPPARYHSTTRVVWMTGVHVSPAFFYSTVYWPQRHVVIVRVHEHHHHHHHTTTIVRHTADRVAEGDFQRWQHDPAHRRGVTYRSETLNREYGRYTASDTPSRRAISEPASAEMRFTTWEPSNRDARGTASQSSGVVTRQAERQTTADTLRTRLEAGSASQVAAQPANRTDIRTTTQPTTRTSPSVNTRDNVNTLRQVNQPSSALNPSGTNSTTIQSRSTVEPQRTIRSESTATRVTPNLPSRTNTSILNRTTVRQPQATVRTESPVTANPRTIQSPAQSRTAVQPTGREIRTQGTTQTSGTAAQQRTTRDTAVRNTTTRTSSSSTATTVRSRAER